MEQLLTNKTVERLKYDMVKEGILSFEDLQMAENFCGNKKTLAYSLIELGVISEKDFLAFIEKKLHIPGLDLDNYVIDKKCLDFINKSDALEYKILPLFKIEDVLTVAMSDPLDLFAVSKLLGDFDFKVEPVLCSESSLLRAIENNYDECIVCRFDSGSGKNEKNWRQILEKASFDIDVAEDFVEQILICSIKDKLYEITIKEDGESAVISFSDQKNKNISEKIPLLVFSPIVSVLKKQLDNVHNDSQNFFTGSFNYSYGEKEYNIGVSKLTSFNNKELLIKIYPLNENFHDEVNQIMPSFDKAGLVAVCSNSDISRVSFAYSLLSRFNLQDKKVFTCENYIKKKIREVYQFQSFGGAGISPDKVLNLAQFHSADILWIEGSLSFEFLNYLTLLVCDGKTVIVEFCYEDRASLGDFLEKHDFSYLLSYVNGTVLV